MKKTAIALIVFTLTLGACNKPSNNPSEPSPAPAVSESLKTIQPEPTRVDPTRPETEDPEPERTTVKPGSSVTTTEADTPANQFAKRWGLKYPSVPEYAILKAANGVCVVVGQYHNWLINPIALGTINEIVAAVGIAENDAVEFTQDAEQNYCSSVSNPT